MHFLCKMPRKARTIIYFSCTLKLLISPSNVLRKYNGRWIELIVSYRDVQNHGMNSCSMDRQRQFTVNRTFSLFRQKKEAMKINHLENKRIRSVSTSRWFFCNEKPYLVDIFPHCLECRNVKR